jgi:hypothetical protein
VTGHALSEPPDGAGDLIAVVPQGLRGPGFRHGYEDRTYHGIEGAGSDGWQPARLLAEQPEDGPTQRENMTVLQA